MFLTKEMKLIHKNQYGVSLRTIFTNFSKLYGIVRKTLQESIATFDTIKMLGVLSLIIFLLGVIMNK